MRISEDDIFQFIVAYIKENQCAPAYREIAVAMDCSTSTVSHRLNILQTVGKVELVTGASRSIRVPGYQFVEKKHNHRDGKDCVSCLNNQSRKDLTTLASDFRLLEREDVQEIIETSLTYAEGQRRIMRVYENVYM